MQSSFPEDVLLLKVLRHAVSVMRCFVLQCLLTLVRNLAWLDEHSVCGVFQHRLNTRMPGAGPCTAVRWSSL